MNERIDRLAYLEWVKRFDPQWVNDLFDNDEDIPSFAPDIAHPVFIFDWFDNYIGSNQYLQQFRGFYYAETSQEHPKAGYIFNPAGQLYAVAWTVDGQISTSAVSGTLRFYSNEDGNAMYYIV